MKISEVLNCTFSEWYSRFKDHTIKSCILPLPTEFVDYLLADKVVLPEGTVMLSANNDGDDSDEEENKDDQDDVDWESEEGFAAVAEEPCFPEFEAEVKAAIKKLGGMVFPKLNWSAPRDASWISFDKTLKCTCPSDIYLLLKSSDFVCHDLTQPFHLCSDDENIRNEALVKYELVLRRWQELNLASEFRCFVKDNTVIGICQRHNDMFHNHLVEEKNDIIADILSFHSNIIKGNFPDKNYCFDVYRHSKGKLLLLDFNPYGPVTDSLLFSWDELLQDDLVQEDTELQCQVPEFRCIEDAGGVQPNPYSTYAVPKDFVDISSGQDPEKLMELLKLKIEQENRSNNSDDDAPDVGPVT